MRFVTFDPPISPDKLPDDGWYGVVYQYRNVVNGKLYVGSTNEPVRRDYDHRYILAKNEHHSKYFQNAWNKYGADCFIREIREIVYAENHAELLAREQIHLDITKCYEPKFGYNVAISAFANFTGRTHSEETKDLFFRKPQPQEVKDKISISLTGRSRPNISARLVDVPRSQEIKNKISQSMLGVPKPKGHGENVSAGLKVSEKAIAQRERLRVFNTDRPLPPEHIQHLKEAHTDVPLSPEHVESMKKGWAERRKRLAFERAQPNYVQPPKKIKGPQSEEQKKHIGDGNRGKIRTPATIQSLKDGQAKRRDRENAKKEYESYCVWDATSWL